MRRIWGVVAAGAVAWLFALPGPAAADDDYAGDIRATFSRWVAADGTAVTALKPGAKVEAEYTIKNSRPYPVVITGMDSQAQPTDCRPDVARASNKLDPKGVFPLRLAPGEVSRPLRDEVYTMAATARCQSVTLRWFGNVTAEHQTAVPSSAPPVVTTAVDAPVTTVVTVEEEPATRDGAATPNDGRSLPVPFLVVGTVVLVTVILGIITTMVGRRPGRKWHE